jgi:hypothetical protein
MREDSRRARLVVVSRPCLEAELRLDRQLTKLSDRNGRIDHGTTRRERERAIAAVKGKIEAFNQRVSSEQRLEV